MAKDKDRSVNPATAQRKLEKQKALKKGKAQVAAQRTERYAARNPKRLESQIADLHALRDSQNGTLSSRDKKQLEDLERDVARIKRARESLGDKAPQFGRSQAQNGRDTGRDSKKDTDRSNSGGARGSGGYGGLGKRHRNGESVYDRAEQSDETDEEVRRIPWPRDTPPPIPKSVDHGGGGAVAQEGGRGSKVNAIPLHSERYPGGRSGDPGPAGTVKQAEDEDEEQKPPDLRLPPKPQAPVRTTYESKAQIRDLRKEATAKFMPQAVKRKIDATKGAVGGKLLEEEDLQRLEREGYGGAGKGGQGADSAREVQDEAELKRLDDEEAAFERELGAIRGDENDEGGTGGLRQNAQKVKAVQMEEVSDEDADL